MIIIEQGESSPYVCVNPENNKLIIRGNSFVSNPSQFYHAVVEWGKNYTTDSKHPLNVEITMGYYSTSNIQLLNLLFKTIYSNTNGALDINFFISKEEEEDLEETMLSLIFNTGLPLKKNTF